MTMQRPYDPPPGSDAAIAQGCRCPVFDNGHGRGVTIGGETRYWIMEDCPLHGRKERDEPEGNRESA